MINSENDVKHSHKNTWWHFDPESTRPDAPEHLLHGDASTHTPDEPSDTHSLVKCVPAANNKSYRSVGAAGVCQHSPSRLLFVWREAEAWSFHLPVREQGHSFCFLLLGPDWSAATPAQNKITTPTLRLCLQPLPNVAERIRGAVWENKGRPEACEDRQSWYKKFCFIWDQQGNTGQGNPQSTWCQSQILI